MFSLENVTLSLVNYDHLISHNACIIYHLQNRPWENTRYINAADKII